MANTVCRIGPVKNIRTLPGGIYAIPRSDAVSEAYMDDNFERCGRLQWRVRVDAEAYHELENKHAGSVAHIIGKGPSLDKLRPITDGIIITLNEAIHRVEDHGLGSGLPTYALTQDTGISVQVKDAVLLLHRRLAGRYDGHKSPAYFFSETYPFPMVRTLSVCAAIRWAKYLGCRSAALHCFDAAMTKDTRYATCIGHQPTMFGGRDERRYLGHRADIEREAQEVGLEIVFVKE